MENNLYHEHVEVYDIIANDRNFADECETLLKKYNQHGTTRSPKVLELFSGPAYHSQYLKEQHGLQITAIDNSEEMKALAISQHALLDSEYFVGTLPDCLSEFSGLSQKKFDIVFVMRFSLGLLSCYEDAEALLEKLFHTLNDNGIIAIELHQQELILNQLDDLDIRVREQINPITQERIQCVWPSGQLQWNAETSQVTMPVEINIESTDKTVKKINTSSTEILFTMNDIEQMLAEKNCSITLLEKNETDTFQQSNIVIIRKIT